MRVCVSTQLSDGLRHTEGQFSEGGVSGAGEEPDWLRELRQRFHGLQVRVGALHRGRGRSVWISGIKNENMETNITSVT